MGLCASRDDDQVEYVRGASSPGEEEEEEDLPPAQTRRSGTEPAELVAGAERRRRPPHDRLFDGRGNGAGVSSSPPNEVVRRSVTVGGLPVDSAGSHILTRPNVKASTSSLDSPAATNTYKSSLHGSTIRLDGVHGDKAMQSPVPGQVMSAARPTTSNIVKPAARKPQPLRILANGEEPPSVEEQQRREREAEEERRHARSDSSGSTVSDTGRQSMMAISNYFHTEGASMFDSTDELRMMTADGGGGGGGADDDDEYRGVRGQIHPALTKSARLEKRRLRRKTPTKKPKATAARRRFRWKLAADHLLGRGAYGQVHLALDLDSGQLMAVKQVLVEREVMRDPANKHLRALQNEVALLAEVDHTNIVKYLGIEQDDKGLNIFMEYVPGGSIASLISQFGSLSESLVCKFTKQILEGLEYLHNKGIAHRDIKGGNILIDVTGRCKISDFGTSSRIADLAGEKDEITGTPYWMAPEVIRQEGHGRKVDIWSLGCTIIEMTTGKPPWHHMKNPAKVLFHIGSTNDPPAMPEDLCEEGVDFIRQCFIRDPYRRPSATNLLQHPWLQSEEAEMPDTDEEEEDVIEVGSDDSDPYDDHYDDDEYESIGTDGRGIRTRENSSAVAPVRGTPPMARPNPPGPPPTLLPMESERLVVHERQRSDSVSPRLRSALSRTGDDMGLPPPAAAGGEAASAEPSPDNRHHQRKSSMGAASSMAGSPVSGIGSRAIVSRCTSIVMKGSKTRLVSRVVEFTPTPPVSRVDRRAGSLVDMNEQQDSGSIVVRNGAGVMRSNSMSMRATVMSQQLSQRQLSESSKSRRSALTKKTSVSSVVSAAGCVESEPVKQRHQNQVVEEDRAAAAAEAAGGDAPRSEEGAATTTTKIRRSLTLHDSRAPHRPGLSDVRGAMVKRLSKFMVHIRTDDADIRRTMEEHANDDDNDDNGRQKEDDEKEDEKGGDGGKRPKPRMPVGERRVPRRSITVVGGAVMRRVRKQASFVVSQTSRPLGGHESDEEGGPGTSGSPQYASAPTSPNPHSRSPRKYSPLSIVTPSPRESTPARSPRPPVGGLPPIVGKPQPPRQRKILSAKGHSDMSPRAVETVGLVKVRAASSDSSGNEH